jgi:hypothetical protein
MDALLPEEARMPAHEDTTRFIVEYTRVGPLRQLDDVDAMDSKSIQLFSVASAIIGLAAFAFAGGGSGWVTLSLIPAIASYVAVVGATFQALKPRRFKGGHQADWLWEHCWEDSLDEIQRTLAASIPKDFEKNSELILEKAQAMGRALVACAAEAGFVAIALLASRF